MDDSYSGGVFTYGGDSVTIDDILSTYISTLCMSIGNITVIYNIISGNTDPLWNVALVVIFILDIIWGFTLALTTLMAYGYYYDKRFSKP